MNEVDYPTLSDVFSPLNTRREWKNVKIKTSDASSAENCDIVSTGPIFSFYLNTRPSFFVLLPNFSPMKGNEWHSLVLQNITDFSIHYSLVFASQEESDECFDFVLEINARVQEFLPRFPFSTYKFEENLVGIIPKAKKVDCYKCELIHENGSMFFQASSSKITRGKSEIIIHYKIKLYFNTMILCTEDLDSRMGPNSIRAHAFQLYDHALGKNSMSSFLCNTHQNTINWCMSMYVLSNFDRMKTVKFAKCNIKETEKSTKSRGIPAPTSTSTSQETQSVTTRKETVSNPIDSKKVESNIPTRSRAENVSIHRQKLFKKNENPNQIQISDIQTSAAATAAGRPSVRIHRRTTVRKNENPFNNPRHQSISRRKSTFLGNDAPIVEIEQYEAPFAKLEKEAASLPKPTEFTIPDFNEILNSLQIPTIAVENNTIEYQLKASFETLEQDQPLYNFKLDPIEPNEKIIESTVEKFSDNRDIDFKSFFNFSEFEYDPLDIEFAVAPNSPYLIELMRLIETISTEGLSTISIDNTTGKRFAFLISVILLNGLKDIDDKLENETILLEAMKEFENYIPGFEKICEKASAHKTCKMQATIITYQLLSSRSLIPFFKIVQKQADLILMHYKVSALIASDSTLDSLIALLSPLMSSLNFLLNDKVQFIDSATAEDINHYIITPAFGYLEINTAFSNSQLVRAAETQLKYGLRQNKNLISYLSDISHISGHSANSEWCDFVAYLKTLKTGNLMDNLMNKEDKIHSCMKEAVARRKLHIWFLFLVVNVDKINEYYYADSTVADPMRIKHVVTHIARRMTKPK